MPKITTLLALSLPLILAAPASAETAPAAALAVSATTQVAVADPMICHSQEEIGSRLRSKKVCMHRSEWETRRQEEHQVISRTQVLRGVGTGN